MFAVGMELFAAYLMELLVMAEMELKM